MMWSLYSHCDGNWRVCIIYFNLYILLTYSTLDCMLHAKQPANFVQLPTQILSNRILILLNKEMYIDSVLARYVATLRVASRDSRFASLRVCGVMYVYVVLHINCDSNKCNGTMNTIWIDFFNFNSVFLTKLKLGGNYELYVSEFVILEIVNTS